MTRMRPDRREKKAKLASGRRCPLAVVDQRELERKYASFDTSWRLDSRTTIALRLPGDAAQGLLRLDRCSVAPCQP